jgi:outer membrane protein assembly factor BamB
VLERNKHASRDGHFVQPMLSKANAAKLATDADFKASFTGNMWASPLYLENGPGGKGAFFAVTTSNDVFALDEAKGNTVWTYHLGDSPMANGVSCGNIHPLGILSTPVIDADARTIFVAGALGTNAIARHEIHAISIDDGKVRPNWPLDVSTLKYDQLQFNPPAQNQRSALSLVNGVVYVAYGGHVGDCGDYHGWVVGVDSKDPSKHGTWATLGRGEAIWAAGGMASDGKDIFAVTGNSTTGVSSRTSSDSEEVVRLNGMAAFDRKDADLFYPGTWRQMDSTDADFGASSPLFLRIPGATPESYVLAIAKDGHMYLLDSAKLGGMGGQVVDFSVSSGNMSIRTVPAAYATSDGVNVVFSTVTGAKCPGGTSGAAIMSVHIAAGAPPKPEVTWCTSFGGGETAPIVTTTDGKSEPIVWFMDQGKLRALDAETGKALWTSSDSCSGVRKWTSPIAVKGRIVVGGDNHLCSWSPH